MSDKYTERCTILRAIREMQIKMARYHFIATGMAMINKKVNKKMPGNDIEKLNPYVKQSTNSEKQSGSASDALT